MSAKAAAKRKGNTGEKSFDLLAERAGFVVHSPDDDQHGWDRMLEYLLPDRAGVPLDRRAAPLKIMTQVKTSSDHAYVDFKLDQIEKPAKDNLPWLLVLVFLDSEDKAAEVRLLHVDTALIESVLERLRVLASEGADTGGRTFRVSWENAKIIAPTDRDALLSYVLGVVGDPAEYATRKIETVRNSGKPTWAATVTFGHDVPRESLSNSLVGLGDPLPFKRIEWSEIRFGITLPVRTEDTPGTLEFQPTALVQRIAIEAESGERAEATVRMYVTPHALGAELSRVRLTNGVVEVLVRGWKEVDLSVKLPDTSTLEAITQAAAFFGILQRAEGGTCSLELFRDDGESIRVKMRVDAVPAFDSYVLALFSGAKNLLRIARDLNVDVEREAVRVDEVASRSDDFATFVTGIGGPGSGSVIVDPRSERSRLSGSENKLQADIRKVTRAKFLLHVKLPFDSFFIVVVVSITGPAQLVEVGDGVRLSTLGTVAVVRLARLRRTEGDDAARRLFLEETLKRENQRSGPTEAVVSNWRSRSRLPPNQPKAARRAKGKKAR